MKNLVLVFGILSTLIVVFHSCRKDHGETDVDKLLFQAINQDTGYTYYQNGSVLAGAAASPHGSFKLRYNTIAQSVLDASGELPAGNSFPTGSVIVKEIMNGGSINLYAIMKKDPTNQYAESGWLWAEIKPNGTASFTAAKKGSGCVGCHGETPNRDFIRTFDFH